MFKEQKILGEKRLNDYTQPLETRITKKTREKSTSFKEPNSTRSRISYHLKNTAKS